MRNKEEQSSTFKYKSKFTGEYIMAHQYIAEIMVDRKAFNEKAHLPYKYWTTDEKWKKEFKMQVQQAGKLLKKYSVQAIMSAINKNLWCYSLLNPTLIEDIKKEQRIITLQESQAKNEEIVVKSTEEFIPIKKSGGLLGKLNENRNKKTN